MRDDVLNHIATAFHSVLSRESEPTDRLFLDGLQAALVGRPFGEIYTGSLARACRQARAFRKASASRARFYRGQLSGRTLTPRACRRGLSERISFLPSCSARLPDCRQADMSPCGGVREAKRLLELGGPPLVEIALENGFGSQANFTRVFRKATGLTPGQYRALHRG